MRSYKARQIICGGVGALLGSLAVASDDTTVFSDRDAYLTHCAACHLESGEGVPSAFPPLDVRLGQWAATEAGRDYLVSVISKGLFGPIEVNGTQYMGAMPPMTHLSTEEIAGILNYVITEFGGAERASFTADEVYTIRERLGPGQSGARRPEN